MEACRSNKQDEKGDGIGKISVDECSTSCYREGTPASKHRRRREGNADSELGESMQDKLVTALVLDRSRNRVQTAPRSAGDAGCAPVSFKGRHNLEGHVQKNATHGFRSRRMDFIDLTDDEDPAEGRSDEEGYLHEERSEIYRKRKRSQAPASQGATEICPVCNDLLPREVWYP